MNDNLAIEQKNLKISLLMVMLLMIWGLIFCELTDSNIVELDAGAYIISGFIGLITLYVSKLQKKPSDRIHPFGYIGFIPILNLIRSFMILLICLKAIGSSIGDMISAPPVIEHDIVFLYAGVTLLFNIVAYTYIYRSYLQTKSDILKVDAVEWKIDIYFNVSVLLAFGISFLIKEYNYITLASYVDPVTCIVLSIFMSFTPLKMFKENIKKLSISSVDQETYQVIKDRFYNEIPHIRAFNPHLTTIDMSGMLWVEIRFDITKKDLLNKFVLVELEERGKKILSEIKERHHLTFNLID